MRRNRPGRHVARRVRTEGNLLPREPGIPGVGRQDDRHAAMHRRHGLVGGSGEDRAGLDSIAWTALRDRSCERRALRHRPSLPQAGEDQGLAVMEAEQPGLAGSALALPFVEAVGRDQAAAMAEGRPEGGLLSGGLGPGVDELVADRGVLGPSRDQPPAQHGERAAVRRSARDRHVLTRRNVVAGP